MAKFVTKASIATWWPKLEPMLIALHVGQIWNQCWWRHLVVKFRTNTSGTALAKCVTNASGILFSWRDNSSYRLYTLGPLCLWQCFGQHSEITSTCITPGLLQVRGVHKLHKAQMQGFLQALLVKGFVSRGFVFKTEIIFDAHADSALLSVNVW